MDDIHNWLMHRFRLVQKPSHRMIQRVLPNALIFEHLRQSEHQNRKKKLAVANKDTEEQLYDWVCRAVRKGIHISDELIQKKANRLYTSL